MQPRYYNVTTILNKLNFTQEVGPQKRAALVLDRLLIALQKALHEESGAMRYERPDRDGPRTAPLRIATDDFNDMVRISLIFILRLPLLKVTM